MFNPYGPFEMPSAVPQGLFRGLLPKPVMMGQQQMLAPGGIVEDMPAPAMTMNFGAIRNAWGGHPAAAPAHEATSVGHLAAADHGTAAPAAGNAGGKLSA